MSDPTYMLSENVYVFPSTRRANKQLTARLMSETSITGLINNFIDTDGYVITDFTSANQSQPFEFNIYGYYFKIASASAIISKFPTATKIFAYISLDKSGDYYELQGQDVLQEDSDSILEYQGVKFIDQDPANVEGITYDKKLQLFERSNSSASWNVPEFSMVRFISGFAFDIKEIDGGQI